LDPQKRGEGEEKMKRSAVVYVILVAVFMFLISAGSGIAHQESGMMGQGPGSMMGGMMMDRKMGHSRGGVKAILHQWTGLLFKHKDELGLTDDQMDEIQRLINSHLKTAIRKKAEKRIIGIELREFLMGDEVDLTEVEKRIRVKADLKADLEIDGMQTMEKVKKVLSEEQREKVRSLFRPLLFPMEGRAHCAGMMRKGGGMRGKQGMMGSGGMMQGMMGQGSMMGQEGMMGQGMTEDCRGKNQPKMGMSSSSLTKTDSQGPVTLEITYDPQGQATRDQLVFKVAMDTHSVELGDFDLGQVSVLHNDQGVEVGPSGWTSPGAGGHHVKGELVFPAVDPSGKPLLAAETQFVELRVKEVGGIQERVFRWDLAE
jgi:hypothetical protein